MEDEIVSTGQQEQQQQQQQQDSTASKSFRVKVYKLIGEGEANWQDQGTGFCVYNMVNL